MTFLALSRCQPQQMVPPSHVLISVPFLTSPIKVDGELDEACYRQPALVSEFVIAGEPKRKPARTQAWLFWNHEQFIFAFECDDDHIVSSPPSVSERDVDPQDRVELFLWSGREADPYYCIEISARDAVHDYSARFYRKFDDSWSPTRWQHAVKFRPGGYQVEAALSREALEQLGFFLHPNERWKAGLFRADFSPDRPETPDWITWVDARTPQPDFHVAGAFGILKLTPPPKRGWQ